MKVQEAILSAADVVECARGWVGVRFRHQGREKALNGAGMGCDCLGLLVGVARELDLRAMDGRKLAAFDERDYGHLPDGQRLARVLGDVLVPVKGRAWRPGDVLLLRFDGVPQHLAIVSAHPQGGMGIIHAYASARKVVEHRLDGIWQERVVQGFRLPQLA